MSAPALAALTRTRSAAAAPARPLRVALLGFGVVGQAVARILTERGDLADTFQLTHVFNRNVARKRVSWVASSTVWTDQIDDVFDAAPDVVVELVGGVEPAFEWVHRALRQGASVVTANKALLAEHGPELMDAAIAQGGHLRCEASVAGGIPLINAVTNGIAGDVITGVAGILNGTCNYVLSRMSSSGLSMADALEEATRLGYAEADPAADLDGSDAAAKLAILAGVALGRRLQLRDIAMQSIRGVSAVDVVYARRLGRVIRQVASVAVDADGTLQASVGPVLVPSTSSLGRMEGPANAIAVTGVYGGTTEYAGRGAGGGATAVAVVSDLLGLLRESGPQRTIPSEWARVSESPSYPFYVRFVVDDRTGILSDICTAFARRGVSVDAVLQEPGFPKQNRPFVVVVEPTRERALRRALDDLATSTFQTQPPLVLPMLFE